MNNLIKISLVILSIICFFNSFRAQEYTLRVDSLEYYLGEVDIVANNNAYQLKYARTKYFVKDIYVYSVLAAEMLNNIEDSLTYIEKKKAKKKYIKKSYKELKKEFGYEISQMTITRGHYLMKIIHKETGRTAYDIIKQYKGGATAKTWEAVLKLNGTTLKKEYSPEIEDIVLDKVLKDIEEGIIIPKQRLPVTERGRKAARKRKKIKRKKDKQNKRQARKKKSS